MTNTKSISVDKHRCEAQTLSQVVGEAEKANKITSPLAIVRAAIAHGYDNGDHFLSHDELRRTLRKFERHEPVPANWGMYVAARNLLRDLGMRCDCLFGRGGGPKPDQYPKFATNVDLSSFTEAYQGTDGQSGCEIELSVFFPRGPDGKPVLGDGAEAYIVRVARSERAKQTYPEFVQPVYNGPFPITADGFIAESQVPTKVVQDGAVQIDTLKHLWKQITLGDEEACFGPLPLHKGGAAEARSLAFDHLSEEWTTTTGKPPRVTATLDGNLAFKEYLLSRHAGGEDESLVRRVFDELCASGQIKSARYYELSEPKWQHDGADVWGDGSVLVLVDKQGQVFGFREGTLFE